jgi:hypothetical protein
MKRQVFMLFKTGIDVIKNLAGFSTDAAEKNINVGKLDPTIKPWQMRSDWKNLVVSICKY